MTHATLLINEQQISLREGADLDALRGAIVAAVRSGGDFVHVVGVRGRTFDVLITASTRATIRTTDNTLEATTGEGGWAPTMELDFPR